MPMLFMHWKSWWQPEPVKVAQITVPVRHWFSFMRAQPSIAGIRVLQFMCTLQAPGFVFVSFVVEIDWLIGTTEPYTKNWCCSWWRGQEGRTLQRANHFLQACISCLTLSSKYLICCWWPLQSQWLDRAAQRLHMQTIRDRTRLASYQTVSYVALFMSAHVDATMSLCLSGGAYRTTSYFL